MGKKLYPTDTLEQAQTILVAWKHINPSLVIGPVSAEALSADITKVRNLQETIKRLKNELITLRNERDRTCLDIYDKVKRARSGIKAMYGEDSTEYQLAGGTRRSDRKPYRRKEQAMAADEISELEKVT